MKLEEDLACSIVLQSKYYGIVKSILRQVVDSSRIAYRDTASYFGILLDDNNRKWICRIQLEGSEKHIVVSEANKI